jgi:AraC-like DNA-binding protein
MSKRNRNVPILNEIEMSPGGGLWALCKARPRGLQGAVGRRCVSSSCMPEALAGLAQTWSTERPQANDLVGNAPHIFIEWVERFCAEMQQTHPESLAQRVAILINENVTQSLSIPNIAAAVGAHQASIRRAFHREFGMTLREYHVRARVERAHILLCEIPLSKVEPIGLALGWRTKKRLYQAVRKVRGCTPGALRDTKNPR